MKILRQVLLLTTLLSQSVAFSSTSQSAADENSVRTELSNNASLALLRQSGGMTTGGGFALLADTHLFENGSARPSVCDVGVHFSVILDGASLEIEYAQEIREEVECLNTGVRIDINTEVQYVYLPATALLTDKDGMKSLTFKLENGENLVFKDYSKSKYKGPQFANYILKVGSRSLYE